MDWSISDFIQWGASKATDPDWARKLFLWVVILAAAWLLLRSRSSSSRSG
jgi:uncharacterized membrane protein YfcA